MSRSSTQFTRCVIRAFSRAAKAEWGHFGFQPSLDRNRIMALAELQFINRAEAVHLIGPPGTGKTHLSLALGVEAVKAGRSVYFGSLADIIAALSKAEREGSLRFDSVDHGWLVRMLGHRIADPRVLRLIERWLKAGVLESGRWEPVEVGTPQGSGISCKYRS
jgi:hypothetical protein